MTAPIRLAHLGLGNFFRAHQAWYTQLANDGHPDDAWGYAAFTGRSPDAARTLSAAGDVYPLITCAADGDMVRTIDSVVAAYDGADAYAWRDTLASPQLAALTLTVTEAGYRLRAGADGTLALDLDDPEVAADLVALRRGGEGAMRTAPARVLDGLISRRAAASGAIALVPCDNLAGNGALLRTAVTTLVAELDDDGLLAWIAENVAFVSTMVDRITPAGPDPVTVVTEPFSEWVIAGAFPAGRPAWHEVGVRFVADVEPFEKRKLWLLNAGHSLLAYEGLLAGHETVDQAFADPVLREQLESLWDEVRPVLLAQHPEVFDDAQLDAALDALRTRFANPRIAHRLAQIALNGEEKLQQRQRAIIRAREQLGMPAAPAAQRTIDAFEDGKRTQ